MTEEAQAYADLTDQLAQKEQRIQELEGLLMGALFCIEELEQKRVREQAEKIKELKKQLEVAYSSLCQR